MSSFVTLWKNVTGRSPTNEELCCVIENVEALRLAAAEQLLKQRPTNDDLCFIISYVEPLRLIAAKRLRRRKLANKEMCLIIGKVPALRQEVCKELIVHSSVLFHEELECICLGLRETEEGKQFLSLQSTKDDVHYLFHGPRKWIDSTTHIIELSEVRKRFIAGCRAIVS